MDKSEKVTSKQVLLPFFHSVDFTRLDIICSHVPPWFHNVLENLNMKAVIEDICENEFKVTIYKL